VDKNLPSNAGAPAGQPNAGGGQVNPTIVKRVTALRDAYAEFKRDVDWVNPFPQSWNS